MKINFTNDDRVALNAWLNTDLGQKFLRALEGARPKIEGTEINQLAISGAMSKGYVQALEEIDSLRRVQGGNPLDVKYIETHKD
jgi:hypothetical protein